MNENTCPFFDKLPHENGGTLMAIGIKDGRAVLRCPSCGLVVCPQRDAEEYIKRYSTPGRYFEDRVSQGYSGFKDRFKHDYTISEVRAKNIVQQLSYGCKGLGPVLDVGCGNCALLNRLKSMGFQVSGVDLDPWMLTKASDFVPGVKMYCGDFLEMPAANGQFGVILFVDSFEHFLDPSKAVSRVDALLCADGKVVIEMPDIDSEVWDGMDMNWIHMKPLEHPFLYGARHIGALFNEVGIVIVNIVYTIPGRVMYFLGREGRYPK